MTEPYGGQAWIQQQIQAAVQAALQQINWSQLMGYGYPSMYEPGAQQAPTLNEAYYAIYQNRPDLQEQHERKYSDWSVTRYIQHWWEGSGEMNRTRNWTDPATGMEWRNTKDQTVVEFAIARGYVDPGPDPASDYGMEPTSGYYRPPKYPGDPGATPMPWDRWAAAGEREPTLERQRFESDEAYRQAMLEFDREKQTFIETFAYDEMGLNEALERLRLSQEQQRYMNEYEIAQANLALQTELGMGDLQLRQLMRLDQVAQQAAELDWARELYYDQATFASRQQDWAEWLGRSDLELRQQMADLDARIAQGELDLQERRFALEDFLGRSQSERENKYYELEYVMAMSQEERAAQRQQWEQDTWQTEHEQRVSEFQQTYGLTKWEAEQRASQFEQQFGLAEQQFGLEEQLGYGQLGLGYLNLLAGLKGPQDWQQYWNVSRAAQATPLPAWAGMLESGQAFPAFGAPGGVPLGEGFTQPQQVSPQQWWNMNPSEQQGLAGMVETGGGWMPDWLRSMQSAWPKGQASPISYFGT